MQGSVSAGASIVRPMPWTPLHASLGETSGDLDFALLERACTERVAARADALDEVEGATSLRATAGDSEVATALD